MDQDFIFRNPPEGQAIQGEPSDIGKPIGFVQSGLLGVLLAGASFVGSPLQPAVTAAAVNDVLLVSPGTYAAEGTITIPKSISLQGIGVAGGSGFTIAAATVANGLIVAIQTALVIGAATLGTGGSFRAVNSVLGSIAGGGTVVLQGSTVVGTIAALQVTATDSTIVGAMTISGALATLTDCSFGPGVVVTFSGAPGVLQLNDGSYQTFIDNGGTVVNGRITSNLSNDPTMALTTPQDEVAAGAAAYVTLNQDGGEPMSYDATTLAAGEVLDVGIDADETNGTTGVHSQLRANRSYIMTGGVLTVLNDSTAFSPALVGGVTPTLVIDLTANFLSLQGRKEAAAGADHKYTGKLYIRRSTVS